MKLVCGSVLLASLLFGHTSANGYFCKPEPRRIQADFLNQCPKPVRDMGSDQIMRTSMQRLSILVGKDSRPPGFCDLPCGGIPHDRETAQAIQAGDQMAVGWVIATPSMSQCQVTLMCPGMRGDISLWRGACGMRPGRIDMEVMLPVDAPTCGFGECFVQWKMETDSGEVFVGCVDIIIIKPPRRPIPEQSSTCLTTIDETTPTDWTPTDETMTDWTPTDETMTDWPPTDETTTEWTPTDETPTEWTLTDETPTEWTPTDESTSVITVTVTEEVPTVTTVIIETTDSTVSTVVTTIVETVTDSEPPVTTAPITTEITVTETTTVIEPPLTVVTSVSTSTERNGLTVWTTITETFTLPPEKEDTESLACPECSDATTVTITEIPQYAPSWPTTEETITITTEETATITTVVTEEITSTVEKKVPITTTGEDIEIETDTATLIDDHHPAYQGSRTMSMPMPTDYHRMRY